MVRAPRLIQSEENEIVIDWEPLSYLQSGGLLIEYDLLWNQGEATSAAEFDLGSSVQPTRTLSNIEKQKHYKFRVKARSACGNSAPSPVLEVMNGRKIVTCITKDCKETVDPLRPDAPISMQRMRPVETSLTGCSIKFDWVAPIHNELDDITEYKVEVRANNGQYITLDHTICGRTHDVYCVVPLQVLDEAPYNLQKGELVVARVSAPRHGVRNPSEPNTDGARVRGLPISP